jgi:hypothetical protein
VAEWSYAKTILVRNQLAQALAARVASGQYSRDDASGVAREILFETPQRLLGMSPESGQMKA